MSKIKLFQTTKILTGAAFLFGIYVFYCIWMMADEKPILWEILYAFGATVSLVSLWGVMKSKGWAVFLSCALMLAALAFGINLVHFVWTFWIFKEPTFVDRILSALHPRVSVFIIFPVVWLAYFSRSGNKMHPK